MNHRHTTASSCRVCDGPLQTVLELGQMPLVNRLVDPKSDREEPMIPLTLAECQGCDLLQLRETVSPEVLFGESYPYFSSSSSTMVASMKELAAHMVDRYTGIQRNTTPAPMKFGRPLRVFEIASNDGYLLQHYKALGHQVLGCEPAEGPRKVAESKGIQTLPRFFTGVNDVPNVIAATVPPHRLVDCVQSFDIVHAHNVVAHVPDLLPFLKGVHDLLMPEGLFVIEVPDAVDTLKSEAFDQIYHEHVFYFSFETLHFALAKAGLTVVEVQKVPLHGGTLRVIAARDTSKRHRHPTGAFLTDRIERRTLTRGLARAVERQSDWLRSAVLTAKESGKRVAAYGASAKGCVRLMQARLGPEHIDFVADKTEAKWGKLMPGVRVPILAASELAARHTDLALLLTWNFAAEIRKEQKAFLEQGGRFLDPLTGRLS